MVWTGLLGTLFLCAACSTQERVLCPPPEDVPATTIYLVSHDWHSGIVLRRRAIADGSCPDQDHLPQGEFLELGWGDRAFYQTPDPHLGTALGALFSPTPSVVHVVAFDGPVTTYFPASEILRIRLSGPGLHGLRWFISGSFARDPDGRVQDLGPGLYGNSRFYRSTERYHLFNTCNVWVARALRAAGCPTTPALSLTVGSLMAQARSFATTVSPRAQALEAHP